MTNGDNVQICETGRRAALATAIGDNFCSQNINVSLPLSVFCACIFKDCLCEMKLVSFDYGHTSPLNLTDKTGDAANLC